MHFCVQTVPEVGGDSVDVKVCLNAERVVEVNVVFDVQFKQDAVQKLLKVGKLHGTLAKLQSETAVQSKTYGVEAQTVAEAVDGDCRIRLAVVVEVRHLPIVEMSAVSERNRKR